MDLFIKLFQSEIGLLSIFTIAFMIVMAIYIYFWVKKQAAKEDQRNS